MKAAFLLDQYADIASIPTDAARAAIKPTKRIVNGKSVVYWIFPKGQVVDGELARHIVLTGQGVPLDDESEKESGLSPDQLKRRQVNYEMTAKGINRPEDRELYLAGVITGYDDKTLEYLHGPNWESYQTALQAQQDRDDEEAA